MDDFRYRVVGFKGETGTPVALESFAYNIDDARSKAAFHRRWGYTAWVERQQIVQPPAWERV